MTSERDLQTQVFDFFALALPSDAVAFTIPNGDRAMTRAPGTLSGMPDIGIIYRGRIILIELKTAIGAVRPKQKFIHDRLKCSGATVTVCRSLTEVVDFLTPLMPLKARLAA